jgi:hypothetical protein
MKLQGITFENKVSRCNTKTLLYNAQDIRNDTTHVIVTEGELKADLLKQIGYCSVAMGGTNIAENYSELIAGKTVILMPDSADSGREALPKWIEASRNAKEILTYDLFPDSKHKHDPQDIRDFAKIHGEKWAQLFNENLRKEAIPAEDEQPEEIGKIYTVEQIVKKKTETEDWIINGIIPKNGVSVLFSPPRIGKSFWILDICAAVTTGGIPMSNPTRKVDADDTGKCLYISLEDTDSSMKNRMKRLNFPETENMLVAFTWRHLDKGGTHDIRRFCEKTDNLKLIVIDTFVKVKATQKNNDKRTSYEFSAEAVEELQRIARRYEVGIVIVWHANKATLGVEVSQINKDNFTQYAMDSAGLIGNTDCAIMLMRSHKRNNTGKLIAAPKGGKALELEMKYDEDNCVWIVTKDEASPPKPKRAKRSTERDAIIKVLLEKPKQTPAEVAKALGRKSNAVKTLMFIMLKSNELERVMGKYSVKKSIADEYANEYTNRPTESHEQPTTETKKPINEIVEDFVEQKKEVIMVERKIAVEAEKKEEVKKREPLPYIVINDYGIIESGKQLTVYQEERITSWFKKVKEIDKDIAMELLRELISLGACGEFGIYKMRQENFITTIERMNELVGNYNDMISLNQN